MDKTLTFLKEVLSIQSKYANLLRQKGLTKRALCDLCIPFRDRYGLTDAQALQLARKEMPLAQIVKIAEAQYED